MTIKDVAYVASRWQRYKFFKVNCGPEKQRDVILQRTTHTVS